LISIIRFIVYKYNNMDMDDIFGLFSQRSGRQQQGQGQQSEEEGEGFLDNILGSLKGSGGGGGGLF
jgi:hypothetical protein